MMKTMRLLALIVPFCLVMQSCNPLDTDQRVGTGTIHVEINHVPYDATNVTGTEDMGYYCGGNINGKLLALALGSHPVVGDTLHCANYYQMSPVYGRYDDVYAVRDSNNFVITSRQGQTVGGRFSFTIISGSDTLHFTNGTFHVEFVPSK